MQTASIRIEGMSCGHCVAAVKRALGAVPGVGVEDVWVGGAKVSVDPAQVTPEALEAAVQDAGYEAHVEQGR